MHNPIDARQLANFCEVVNSRSIRRAAKHLNLTTSAISHSLKKLESDLGCKLFVRDTRNLALTYAGERLFSTADSILDNLTRARYLVQEWSEISQKTLRIGATSAACQYIIPMALRELKESFPGMNIQITVSSSYQLLEAIDENRIDVALFPWGKATKKSHISIGTDRLEFIVNPLHSWAESLRVEPSSIESQRVILTDSKGYTYDLVNEYFQSYRQN
ncbi:MAG: LysR family transcriptional regulator, partial [Verrucomicrobiota bacterium]